jgi:N-acetyl-gamma-glutamyl-phosphate reductase
MSTTKVRIGIVGGTGYTGAELIRLVGGHPHASVALVTSTREAGTPVGTLYPTLAGSGLVYEGLDAAAAKERCDVLFVCAPHGVAMDLVPQLADAEHLVIDLSADFRLADRSVYEEWYGLEHNAPELLAQAAYGLTELFRDDVRATKLVANPGCYPTATLLALAPAVKAGLIDPSSIVVDAKSGVSGAGREPSLGTSFSEVAESVSAYKVAAHRHTPEIEQTLARLAGEDVVISFTPHLMPMVRGLLATCYGTLAHKTTTDEVVEVYRSHYAGEPFVTVLDPGLMPATKHVTGSNTCRIGLAADPRSGRLVAVAAIDNLVKGASGQAIQNMNVALGLDETAGLTAIGRVI